MYQLSTPNVPIPILYEPSLAVIVQGKERVVLGGEVFFYDESRYLLTSVDLPALAQVTEAPYLCTTLKLDLPLIRGLIADFDLQLPDSIPPSRGRVTPHPRPSNFLPFFKARGFTRYAPLHSSSAGLIKREIFYRLLVGEQGVAGDKSR